MLLLTLYALLALSSLREKSPVFDEMAHLTGGYSYWRTGDFRLHPENGILPQRWMALPLLFLPNIRFPSLEQPAWWISNIWEVGHQFFYQLGNNLPAMLWAARTIMILVPLLLGWLIFRWSRQLFGPAGGLLSLTLYVCHPSILAHGPLLTSDMSFTLYLTAVVWSIWELLHQVSGATVLRAGVALGALCLSKVSGLVILPMGVLLMGARLMRAEAVTLVIGQRSRRIRPGRQQVALFSLAFAVAAAIAVTVVWAAYGFRYEIFRHAEPGRDYLRPMGWEGMLKDAGALKGPLTVARERQLLPEAYLFGVAYVLKFNRNQYSFLNGHYLAYGAGWWSFFPYCVLVKTPLSILVILGLAATVAIRRRRGRPTAPRSPPTAASSLRSTTPLWVLVAVYGAMAIASPINIGERHILPTYPALFILAGAAMQLYSRRLRWLRTIALGVLALETFWTWPHYLAYFNALAGGPTHGYRHLVDSSLDWGQDLPGLKRWLERHRLQGPGHPPVYLSYFGTGSPQYYGIDAKPLPSPLNRSWIEQGYAPLRGGVYCISATALQAVYPVASGRWSTLYEKLYQASRAEVERFERRREDSPARDRAYQQFKHLRFKRLCAFLRQREPDAQVGYSILIYRLTEEQVHQALEGPPAELVPVLVQPPQ